MKPIQPDLATQLRSAVMASGLTQQELADKSGVGQAKISEFLNGSDMRLSNAGKLAAAIGLEWTKRKGSK
jgi:transcriptional regulator with XRE-family HTH domain